MQDFKESVGNVLRRAISRGYPFSLVAGVWSRFLFRRWQAGDIRRKELVSWLHRAWRYFDRQQLRSGDTQPWGPVRPQSISPEFLAAFGVNTSGPATSPDPPTSSGPAAQPADPPLSDPPLSDPESHGSVSGNTALNTRLRAVFPETELDVDVDREIPQLCALHAVNAILQAFNFPLMSREGLDVFSQRCAYMEE